MYKVLLQMLFQNTVPMAGTNKNCFEVNTSEKLQKKDFRKTHGTGSTKAKVRFCVVHNVPSLRNVKKSFFLTLNLLFKGT